MYAALALQRNHFCFSIIHIETRSPPRALVIETTCVPVENKTQAKSTCAGFSIPLVKWIFNPTTPPPPHLPPPLPVWNDGALSSRCWIKLLLYDRCCLATTACVAVKRHIIRQGLLHSCESCDQRSRTFYMAGASHRETCRAGHFRYFWIFSMIKNDFLRFLSS